MAVALASKAYVGRHLLGRSTRRDVYTHAYPYRALPPIFRKRFKAEILSHSLTPSLTYFEPYSALIKTTTDKQTAPTLLPAPGRSTDTHSPSLPPSLSPITTATHHQKAFLQYVRRRPLLPLPRRRLGERHGRPHLPRTPQVRKVAIRLSAERPPPQARSQPKHPSSFLVFCLSGL